jgi:GxxExxY protein
MNENEIGTIIVDCAVKLHKNLGPGLLESVYEAVLAKQLQLAGLTVQRQVPVPIVYEGLSFDEGFRADLSGRVSIAPMKAGLVYCVGSLAL